MKDLVTLPSFNGVAAGSTATLNLPTMGTYHSLRLLYQESAADVTVANMKTAITGIRLKVNGKTQRTFTATELFALNAFHGVAAVSSHLPIYFAEPWRRTAQGEDVLAWGMQDVSTFQVEVDILAGRTAPTLSAIAEKTLDERAMGPIVKWRRFNLSASGAGILNVQTLPRFENYYGLHMNTANISDLTVKVNQRERWQASRAQTHQLLTEKGWAPQSGFTHVAFDHTSRASDVLQLLGAKGEQAQDFRVDLTMSDAADFVLLTETIGLRD